MRRNKLMRHLCAFTLLGAGIAVVPIHLQAASELEQHLRDQYKGKTLVLRNFYDGQSLRYDASGQLSGPGAAGDWTVDGVVHIDDVRVSGHRLSIRATRLRLGWIRDVGFSSVPSPEGKAGEEYEKAKELHIEANFSGEVTADIADALLAHVFLTSHDYFAELVPDYWKPCVLAGLGGAASKQYSRCQFSPEFRAIPGLVLSSDSNADAGLTSPEPGQMGSGQSAGNSTFHVGHGISPPRPILHPGPEFDEFARQAKYQGVVTVELIVDQDGLPTKIHIVNPLGCGLDEKAVQAVETWTFKPAEKDGQPVRVLIAVEVDFHLY
jgi:TonB family protein